MSEVLQVPWLRTGVGETPSDGGCIMQVVDWISTQGWSDRPECVHPVLRALAIKANDLLDDEGRQKLLDIAPRLMGTNSPNHELSIDLAVWCARRVIHIFEERFPNDNRPRKAIEVAEKRDASAAFDAAGAAFDAVNATHAAHAANATHNATYSAAANAANAANAAAYAVTAVINANAGRNAANAAANAANAAAKIAASNIWSLLTGCLDEYDRLTERNNKTIEITADQWSAVCEVMAVA